jgi:hypothetical protein
LDEREALFVWHLVEGGAGVADNPPAAAKAAGFTDAEAGPGAWKLLAKSNIKQGINRAARDWFAGRVVQSAKRALWHLATDPITEGKHKLAAIQAILDQEAREQAAADAAAPGFKASGTIEDLAKILASKGNPADNPSKKPQAIDI